MEPILLSHGAVSSGFYLHCCCSNVIARIAMPTFVRFKMLVTELDFETYFPQTSGNVSSCELDILRNSKDIRHADLLHKRIIIREHPQFATT